MSWKKYLMRARRDVDFDREIEAHLAHETEGFRAVGMGAAAARQAALRKIGNVATLRESEHERNSLRALEGAWLDLRYAARQIRLSPAYAAVVILSIALGAGANTAIFQLLDAVRLRSLPVRDPQQLASLSIAKPRKRTGSFTGWPSEITNAIWERVRTRQKGFSGMLAWSMDRVNLAPSGEARFAQGLWASGDFFRVLGIEPIIGRTFTAADDTQQCNAGAVISYAFWQRQFGGDPAAIGRTLSINTAPIPIIGVTPPNFFGLDAGRRFDLALPLCAERLADGGNGRIDDGAAYWLGAMGRLKPGWSMERARAQLRAISPGIFESTLPAKHNASFVRDYLALRLTAEPAAKGQSELGRSYESPLWLLLGASGLVLAIACANLASIALARASAREREISVRLAIGASRGRVMRQLLAESLMLAVIGAAAGLLLGRVVSGALAASLGEGIFLDLSLDWNIALFTGGVAVVACVLFGLAPALRVFRLDRSLAQSAGGRGIAGAREGIAARRGLAIVQMALSFALLTGALLFIGSLRNLLFQNPGFKAEGVTIAMVDISGSSMPKEMRARYYLQLLDRIEASRGVSAASEVAVTPIGGGSWNTPLNVELAGGARLTAAETYMNEITPGYFAAMSTPLTAGRNFDANDTFSSPKVAIVNQAFVRKYLKGASPLGGRLIKEDEPRSAGYEIVGVAADAKYVTLREEFHPAAYLAAAQDSNADTEAAFVVRANGATGVAADAIKAAVHDMRPQPILDLRSLEGNIRNSLTRERLMATLSGVYGLLAAILAAIGIYGALSYLVARRRNEIGIRIALGAGRGAVIGMILREAALLAAFGLAIGFVITLAATRAATDFLYGVSPGDPAVIATVSVALIGLALLASFLPARRAAGVDPAMALRQE